MNRESPGLGRAAGLDRVAHGPIGSRWAGYRVALDPDRVARGLGIQSRWAGGEPPEFWGGYSGLPGGALPEAT